MAEERYRLGTTQPTWHKNSPCDRDDGRQRSRLLRVCRHRIDTGCRVPDAMFHAEMVGTFFAFFAGRSLEGGLA
jgi:hypothetical protein